MSKKVEKAIEISDAKISFVSFVDKAANRRQFLIAKCNEIARNLRNARRADPNDGRREEIHKNPAQFSTLGKILKVDEDTHYVTGVVYEPLEEDTHGNFMTEDEIRKAAFWFAKNGDKVDMQHSFEEADGICVVESYIAPCDMEIGGQPIVKGTWIMTAEVQNADGTMNVGNITTFLDESETVRWNSLAFPFEPTGESGDNIPALQAAVVNKIRTLRQKTGKEVSATLVKYFGAGDFDGIINVTNTVELTGGTELTLAQVTAWVAALDAGSTNTQSNTFEPYNGAVRVVGIKDYDASVAAVRRGEFFFTYSEEGEVVVQYDINSLTNFTAPFDPTYRKNRVRRVYDTFRESVRLTFLPNRFDNSDEDWDIIEGLGRALLLEFFNMGAIQNVNYDTDFRVDRARSQGDETYLNIWLQARDSSEKIFVTIRTR